MTLQVVDILSPEDQNGDPFALADGWVPEVGLTRFFGHQRGDGLHWTATQAKAVRGDRIDRLFLRGR